MLLGAHLAGAAIENSMLGAAHALANPLSAHFDVIHGMAIAVMLPHVVRFNAASLGKTVRRSGRGCRAVRCRLIRATGGPCWRRHLAELAAQAGLPVRLADCGVDRGDCADGGGSGPTMDRQFNPRSVDEPHFGNFMKERCDGDNRTWKRVRT